MFEFSWKCLFVFKIKNKIKTTDTFRCLTYILNDIYFVRRGFDF
jgi:hypothetical protein